MSKASTSSHNRQIDPVSLGESGQRLLNLLTEYISLLLREPDRQKAATRNMTAVLFDAPHYGVEAPPLSESQKREIAVIEGFLALYGIAQAHAECEFYFRRYPFSGLPISRADHFRNCCEMVFDRVVQFRDRLKISLNTAKEIAPLNTIPVGAFMKMFDKAFAWDIRQRNAVHHRERFGSSDIEKMSIAHILKFQNDISAAIGPERVYRNAKREWVKRVREQSKQLEIILEHVAAIIVNNCALPRLHEGTLESPQVAV